MQNGTIKLRRLIGNKLLGVMPSARLQERPTKLKDASLDSRKGVGGMNPKSKDVIVRY
ncbi:MAG: hypothetical protein PHW73_15225 [Atribacterota bacterium]|nr:hypothetical protein [Atribacterota bacterium]